jgi:hypothetical protein
MWIIVGFFSVFFSSMFPVCKNKILFVDLGISLPCLLFVGLNICVSVLKITYKELIRQRPFGRARLVWVCKSSELTLF